MTTVYSAKLLLDKSLLIRCMKTKRFYVPRFGTAGAGMCSSYPKAIASLDDVSDQHSDV